MTMIANAHDPFADVSGEVDERPIGRVVAVSGRRVVIAVPGTQATEETLTAGLIVRLTGETDSVAVVLGFHHPAPDLETVTDEVVLADAWLAGRLENGRARRRLAPISIGAEAFVLSRGEEIAARRNTMAAPMVLGETSEGTPVSVDGQKLLGGIMTIEGEPRSGRSASLAVIGRSLLSGKFPARLVLIDPDGLFADSFGNAAEVVDAADGIAPVSMLTQSEIVACLELIDEPLSADEHWALGQALENQAVAGPLGDLLARIDRLAERGDEATGRAFDELAKRLVAAAEDPQLGVFFGESADRLTPQDVLQRCFRLPHGRPPMAIIQLHHLDPDVRGVASAVLVRLARMVAEASQGVVPVLVLIDEADALLEASEAASVMFEPVPEGVDFGVIAVSNARPAQPSQYRLVHRLNDPDLKADLLPSEEDPTSLLYADLDGLRPGEAMLLDRSCPWPQSLTTTQLREKAVPSRRRAQAEKPEMTRAELIDAITSAWQGRSPL